MILKKEAVTDQLELNIVLCIDCWYILFKDIAFYNAYPTSTKEFSCNQLLVDHQILRQKLFSFGLTALQQVWMGLSKWR